MSQCQTTLENGTPETGHDVALLQAPPALEEIVRRHGTPAYAYDLERIRVQANRLKEHLPSAVEIYFSLKANAALGLSSYLAGRGLGADVASAGELEIARAAGFTSERILVTGPDCSPNFLEALRSTPEAIVSIDSVSALELAARKRLPNRLLLRLRPDFRCTAVCSAGSDSRFGLDFGDLPRCREFLNAVRVIGFHVFAGSQVLDAAAIVQHLHDALDESLRAAAVLGIVPEIIDLGGGFGVPYGPGEAELDLRPIGAELSRLVKRATPARIFMELGRYLVAQAGWYLTTVLALQRHGQRRAVVVDGGTHQRGDSCGIGLRCKGFPPLVLNGRDGPRTPTNVLGCLSHPADVLAEAALLPPLAPGDVLAFPNAGAYGLGASPWSFHGHPAPAEAAFDAARIEAIRIRLPAQSILDGQSCLTRHG